MKVCSACFSGGDLLPGAETAIKATWEPIVGNDFEVVVSKIVIISLVLVYFLCVIIDLVSGLIKTKTILRTNYKFSLLFLEKIV